MGASVATESATASTAVAATSLSSKTAALVAEASSASSTSMQQHSKKVSHQESSYAKLSSAEISAQQNAEYHLDHRQRSLSNEKETRLSSARTHEGKVMSTHVETGLESGSSIDASNAAMMSSAIAQSSSESQQKSSFASSSEHHASSSVKQSSSQAMYASEEGKLSISKIDSRGKLVRENTFTKDDSSVSQSSAVVASTSKFQSAAATSSYQSQDNVRLVRGKLVKASALADEDYRYDVSDL